MAFQGNGLITDPNSNYFSFLARKPNEGKIPNPSEMITGSSHTCIIDSRERNRGLYPNPAQYQIKFSQKYKNVTSIELKGSVIPKTEYNVNTGNMYIPFNIQDYITSIVIRSSGYGYVNGVYASGGGLVGISAPAISTGVQALITVTVAGSSITSIVINTKGAGYLRGVYGGLELPSEGFYSKSGASFVNSIPLDYTLKDRFKQAIIQVKIGNELAATLTPGQYDFANPNDTLPGLCREVTRSLQVAVQNAIDDGYIIPVVGRPQTGIQFFPYTTAVANDGSCYLTTSNANASPNVQVCIQRGVGDLSYIQDPFVELLWSSEELADSSASTVLGYGSDIKSSKFAVVVPPAPMDQTNNSSSNQVYSINPIIGRNDYCLVDSPTYCILSFNGTASGDRIESTNSVLDKSFATLVFDANTPDVIFREPNNVLAPNGTGACAWSTLLVKPGCLKAIKGQDFDTKSLSFGPAPLAELSGISLQFNKFNGDLIDFHNRDHLLIFTISAQDVNSGNKW